MSETSWTPGHSAPDEVAAVLGALPDLSDVQPWTDAFGSADDLPESAAPAEVAAYEPPAPLVDVPLLMDAAPLVALPPLAEVTPLLDIAAPAPVAPPVEPTLPVGFPPLAEVAPLLDLAPPVQPPPPVELAQLVEPAALVDLPPLAEVTPLLDLAPPAQPAPVVPETPAEPPAAPRLYVASSWDTLDGAAPEVITPQTLLDPGALLEGRQATEVLAELGFLDD